MGRILDRAAAGLRAIPWWMWLAGLGAAAWFGRKLLLIAATIIAFYPIPVPPLFQGEPGSVEEARLQDLRHFEHVRRNERSWTPETRALFDSRVADLRRRAASLSEAEFMLGLARAQAAIDNGHSNATASAMVRRFPHLPIRMAYFGDELRVLRATEDQRDLLGLRVTQINGVSVEDAAQRLRDAFGGPDAAYRVVAPLLLETPAYLEAVGIAANTPTLRFEANNGATFERTLIPLNVDAIETWTFPGDLAMHWRRDDARLTSFVPATAPLYLQHQANGYWQEDLADLDAVYFSIRTNMDDESGQSLRAFSNAALEALRARPHPPRAIIVDLRFNHGGDYSLTHDLMAELGDIVGGDGRIYFLTSGNTFSAAIVSIAFAKQAAPDRTLIVGEPIGDRLQFWAEGWRYDLPNSGFRARYATAYYDLQNGCEGFFRCYWGAFHLFPVIVDDLDVDIPAAMTFEAYAAGRDPALEAVRQAEAARSGAP